MRGLSAERVRGKEPVDAALASAVILLMGVGLAALFSASYGYSLRVFHDPYAVVLKQALIVLPAAAIMLALSRMNLAFLAKATKLLVLGSLLLLLLPFFPGIGGARNGAMRWIDLGFTTLQPSEIAKFAITVYLAALLSKKEERIAETVNAVLPPLIVTGLFTLVIFLQNDFSTAGMVVAIALVAFWAGKVRLRVFLGLALVVLPVMFLMVFTSEYRLERLIAFMYPSYDASGIGYQVNASLDAIQGGGFWGRGVGQGLHKLASLPEVQNDFIFAAFIEETGAPGLLAYLGILGLFAQRAFKAALAATDSFRRLACFTAASALVLQSLVNVAVAGGMVPATGIPLPFFSSGGSSLLACSAMAGIVLNVSRDLRTEGVESYV